MDVNNIKREVLVATVEINGIQHQQDQIELSKDSECDLDTTSTEFELLPEICDIKLNDPTEIEIASGIQTESSPIEIHNIRLNDETKIEDFHILHSRKKSDLRAGYENYNAVVSENSVNVHEIELNEHLKDANENNIKKEAGSEIFHVTNDVIKLEDTIIVNEEINVNVKNEELYCDNCHDVYEDYCTKCPMLVHILDENSVGRTGNGRMPKNILEIRKVLTSTGIFTLKVIPKGVQFGPYTGLSKSTSKHFWKIKQGKLVGNDVQSNFLHWMWHINPAKNIAEGNLLPFQYKNSLYYRSTCDIQQGEQLLVYFPEEYIDIINDEIERNFTPTTEKYLQDVFACTFCCLGFSSRTYLAKHRTVCCNRIIRKSFSTEITQCMFCKIYMDQQEYRQYHVNYCRKKYTRKRKLPMAVCRTRAEKRNSLQPSIGGEQRNKIFNCLHCKYKTKYNGELKAHTNMHYRVKEYKCRICPRRFKQTQNLKLHVITAHIDTHREGKYQCLTCEFKTYDKWCLNMHRIKKHPASQNKNGLKRHVRKDIEVKRLEHTKSANKEHSKNRLKSSLSDGHKMVSNQFKCADCNYGTTKKQYFKRHIDVKHSKKEKYKSKCDTVKKESIKKYKTIEHSKQKKLRCSICGYEAFSRANFIRHKYTHTKQKPLKCSSCRYRTNRSDSLKTHFEVMHKKVKRYVCTICDYQTHRKIDLNKHVQNEHETLIQLKCAHCRYKTTSEENFKKHMNVRHSIDRNLKCSKCQFEASCFSHFIRHLYIHEKGKKPFKCSLCDYETHRLYSLDAHWLKHNTVKPFKCLKCEFAGKTRGSLERHIKRMHIKSEKHKCREFDCESVFGPKLKKYPNVGRQFKKGKNPKRKNSDCMYETPYLPYLKRHIATRHCQLRKKYKCPKCDFKSAFKYFLQLHVPVHDEEKKFHCSRCNFKTHRKGVLVQHIKKQHEATEVFQCSQCEYRTVYPYCLKVHIESRHSEVKRYKCSKCDFQTVYRGSLESHLRTHAKVKEFKCTKCKYESNVKKKFIVHMQVKHEGRKYECAKCEFKSGYKDSLRAHMELHDNLKKFKCSHCAFETNYKKTINKHNAKKH